MHLVTTAFGGILFCAFVNSASIGSTSCTSPTDCTADNYASHCIKCLGRDGANDPGYCSYIDPAWQSNPCSNRGYVQFCTGVCSEAMVTAQPFLFKGTTAAAAPPAGSDSNTPLQPVTAPAEGQTGSDSNPPSSGQQPVTVPTVGQPGSDSNPPSSGQQPVTVPTVEQPGSGTASPGAQPSLDTSGDKWRRPHRKHQSRPMQDTPSSQQTTPDTPTQESPSDGGGTDKTSKPTTGQPTTDQPTTDQPATDQPATVPSTGEIHNFNIPAQQTVPTFDQNTPGTFQTQPNPSAGGTSEVPTTPDANLPAQGKTQFTGPTGVAFTGPADVASADLGTSSDDNQSNTVAFAGDDGTEGDWTQFGTS